jgi:Mn-containing catalase
MFMHNKKLMYTVRVSEPNPVLANMMLEQFGGPQGELAAAMRYFTQGLSDSDPKRRDMLMDIATEEMSHLEVIGNIVVMLNKGVKGKMAEGLEEGILYSEINGSGGESHTLSLLYGGGAALTNSGGLPWRAEYIDTIGEPTADLRSNIAAEARAKIVYERLINVTTDPGVKDALQFLMTREIAHQKSFEKALYSIEENFPPGKLPGNPKFTDKYFNLSQGEGDARGPWNEGKEWEFVSDVSQMGAVDGGKGDSSVELSATEAALVKKAAARTASGSQNPTTGADLGAKKDGSAGSTKNMH